MRFSFLEFLEILRMLLKFWEVIEISRILFEILTVSLIINCNPHIFWRICRKSLETWQFRDILWHLLEKFEIFPKMFRSRKFIEHFWKFLCLEFPWSLMLDVSAFYWKFFGLSPKMFFPMCPKKDKI